MAGLSKGMSIQDIANKHKVNVDTLKQELKKGIKVEKEHTKDVKRAARIAMDHLVENPKYYTKLAKSKLEENLNVNKQTFESNPELSNIGTLQQYSDYLNTIFPSSKVKDVVYHASPNKIEKFRDTMFGTYFSYSPIKGVYGSVINSVLLNVKNPLVKPKPTDSTEEKITYDKEYRNYNNPSSPYDASIEGSTVTKEGIQIRVKNPEQIYILGSKQDIEGFKQYIKKKSLNENQLNKDLVSEFMKHVMDELKLEKLPKITLSNDSQEAINMKSWGGYRPSSKSINIIIAKRHPADIFRTLAHELVHYKQDMEGRLTPTSGETGSEDENEANSRAAVIMRNFAQAKPNLFEHLTKEGEYGDYLFGDKDSGVKIGWYKDEVEVDTPAEKKLFAFLKKYADSESNVYSNINLDSYLEAFRKLKIEYPDIADSKLPPGKYIYRGTSMSEDKINELIENSNTEEYNQGIIILNQKYSSRRKISSWSTDYFNGASFAMSTAETKGGRPVVMRAKAGDAELFFNPSFMDKLSTQLEEEVFNATNPIQVDIMVIQDYKDEFEDIESGYLSTK